MHIMVTWQICSSSCRVSESATLLPPRRNGRVKAEQELLPLACLYRFLLSITVGLLRKVTDFFLEAEEFTAEDGSRGCLAGRRGGRPRGGGLAGTKGSPKTLA